MGGGVGGGREGLTGTGGKGSLLVSWRGSFLVCDGSCRDVHICGNT